MQQNSIIKCEKDKNIYMKTKLFALIFTIFMSVFLVLGINFLYNIMYPVKYENVIYKYCSVFGVERELVFALINAESSFDVYAVSSVGAKGLMQLLPSTAEYIARKISYKNDINLFNVDCNLNLGIAYISYLQNIFSTLDEVICAYNAGEGVVREWIKQSHDDKLEIRFDETKNYLNKVKYGIEIYSKKLS